MKIKKDKRKGETMGAQKEKNVGAQKLEARE